MRLKGIAHYSQPDFYRFSIDSTELAKYVASNFCFHKGMKVLDLCAGCGVIGLEILYRAPCSLELISVELQPEYIPHFQRNQSQIEGCGHNVQFLCTNFSELLSEKFSKCFDLIVCNPPYFDRESNRPSPDYRRSCCRLISESDREVLVRVIENSLSNDGKCYILLREKEKLFESFKLSSKLKVRVVQRQKDVLLVEALLNID